MIGHKNLWQKFINHSITMIISYMFNINEYENEDETEKENEYKDDVENQQQQVPQQEDEYLRDYFLPKDGETHTVLLATDPKKRRFGIHDFGKGKKPTMWFMITKPEDPEVELEWRVTSRMLMKTLVNRFIKRGKTLVEVHRKGSKQNDTEYRIRAVDENTVVIITNKEVRVEQLPLQQQQQQQQQKRL